MFKYKNLIKIKISKRFQNLCNNIKKLFTLNNIFIVNLFFKRRFEPKPYTKDKKENFFSPSYIFRIFIFK
jgi:hypothetical protein